MTKTKNTETAMLSLPAQIKEVGFYDVTTKQSLTAPFAYKLDANDTVTLEYAFTGATIIGKLVERQIISLEGNPVLVYVLKALESGMVNHVAALHKAILEKEASEANEVKVEEAPIELPVSAVAAPAKKEKKAAKKKAK